MSHGNRSTGFPENEFQPNFVHTQSENNGSPPDQLVDQEERETDKDHNLVVKKCVRYSCKNSWGGQGPENTTRNAASSATRRQNREDYASGIPQFNGVLDNNKTAGDETEGRNQIPGGRQNSPQDNLRAGVNPVDGRSSLKDNCNPKVVIPSPRGSPQLNGVVDDITAGDETEGRNQTPGGRQNSPDDNTRVDAWSAAMSRTAVNGLGGSEDNCNPTAVTSPSKDNPQVNGQGRQTENDFGAVGIQNHQNGGEPQTIRNLNNTTDQMKPKFMVDMEKIPDNVLNRPPPAAQHGPRHENRENIRPPGQGKNDIGTQTQNIPVTPQNTGKAKLVRQCSEETMEHLNDHLLPFYSKNWKHLASRHGWDYERIKIFCHKYNNLAFKQLMFEKEFSMYTVQNLLDDLTHIDRTDLIADYPGEWN